MSAQAGHWGLQVGCTSGMLAAKELGKQEHQQGYWTAGLGQR